MSDIKGKIEELKGQAKEQLGSLTGDKRTEKEGKVEEHKGAIRREEADAIERAKRELSEERGKKP